MRFFKNTTAPLSTAFQVKISPKAAIAAMCFFMHIRKSLSQAAFQAPDKPPAPCSQWENYPYGYPYNNMKDGYTDGLEDLDDFLYSSVNFKMVLKENVTEFIHLTLEYSQHYFDKENIQDFISAFSHNLQDLLWENITYAFTPAQSFPPAISYNCSGSHKIFTTHPLLVDIPNSTFYRDCSRLYLNPEDPRDNFSAFLTLAGKNTSDVMEFIFQAFSDSLEDFCTTDFFDDWKGTYQFLFVLAMIFLTCICCLPLCKSLECLVDFFEDCCRPSGRGYIQMDNLAENPAHKANKERVKTLTALFVLFNARDVKGSDFFELPFNIIESIITYAFPTLSKKLDLHRVGNKAKKDCPKKFVDDLYSTCYPRSGGNMSV